ncbi:hypothetical protein [Vreelandella alkaliphila]|uniref:Uncharacterized protein n=1 Tax=Vreelandella alkaliphila TaxID=272774 RepID=A0A7C9JSH3_9GAMM|nr:hypothetical protein [Halomonas alkaliphila]NDL70524.1 hypothetical protein [Halomonas alkaliphila]
MIEKACYINILKKLAQDYPSEKPHYEFKWHDNKDIESVNMHYLHESGFVEIERVHKVGVVPMYPGSMSRPIKTQPKRGKAKIIKAGMDYLREDGGLTAELNILTIRLHPDTISDIRELLTARIDASNAICEDDKPEAKDWIGNLKDEGVKQLTTRLISLGIDKGALTLQQLKELIPFDGN